MIGVSYSELVDGFVYTDADNAVRFLRPGEEEVGGVKVKVEDEDVLGTHKKQRTLGVLLHDACIWVSQISAIGWPPRIGLLNLSIPAGC